MAGISPIGEIFAGRYEIHELFGSGATAHVYRARDLKHDRDVAVKVLRDELSASLSGDRFNREIAIAAKLTHPHILPLYDSGEAEGRIYFVSPFIAGESLRQRLERERQLPPVDAMRMARAVASALECAHSRGIVHRDIKPENILLTSGQPLVTDFGIARVLQESSGVRTTVTGLIVGTPAYMSPEQSAGEDIDARTDIYSLGCVLYEMLVGEPPFKGRSAQAIIASRFTSDVPDVREIRGELSESLAQLVSVMLARSPGERVQNARELCELLSSVEAECTAAWGSTYARISGRAVAPLKRRPAHVKRVAAATGAVLAIIALAWLSSMGVKTRATLISTGQLARDDRILVADFRVSGLEPGVGTAVAEAVRVSLAESREVTVVPTSVITDALHRMKRSTTEPIDLAGARELAVREGIPIVIAGSITQLGAGFLVGLQLIDVDSGNTLASVQETVDGPRDLLPAVDRLTRLLRSRIGESSKAVRASAPLMRVTTPSLEALQRYTEGMRANLSERDFLKAVRLDEEALALDPEFAMAWRALGAAWANAGFGQQRADSAAAMAFRYRDRLSRRERNEVEAYYYWTAGRDRAKAASAYEALAEEDGIPNGNLAKIYSSRRDFARAEATYRKVIARSPSLEYAYGGLVEALANQGKVAQAESVQVFAQTRFPPNPPTADRGATLLFMRGQLSGYRRRLDSLCLSPDQAVVRRAFDRLAALAIMRGRIAEYERYRIKWRALQAAAGVGPPPLIRDSIYAAVIDIALRRDTGSAVRRLDAALLNEVPKFPRTGFSQALLHMSRAYSQAGRPDRARHVLELELRRLVNPIHLADAQPLIDNVRASIILAEGKPRNAILMYRKSDMLPDGAPDECTICLLYNLGSAYDAAGMTDSAIIMFDAYARTPYFSRLELRGWMDERSHPERLPLVYERLGNLYEKKGDSSRAADSYSQFVELWKDADPELQPRVQSVRSRIVALRGSRRINLR